MIRMPWFSHSRPTTKPGVSTKVMMGRLKALQNVISRMYLSELSFSMTPPISSGLLAMITTGCPLPTVAVSDELYDGIGDHG